MTRHALTLSLVFAVTGCAESGFIDDDRVKTDPGKADSSAEAVILDFEFDGQLLASSSYSPASKIEDQLLYTVGQLNGDRSLGRIDKLEITDIETSAVEGKTLITYHAKMPVAWAERNGAPDGYTFFMPRDISYQAVGDFVDKYSHSCVAAGAHDVDAGSMWYYFRPEAYRCELADEDIFEFEVEVSPSSLATTGKYPEYHQVWKDDVFKVVAIMGKYEDGATSSSDAGISAYNSLIGKVRSNLRAHSPVVTPADLPSSPGVAYPDVTITADLGDGKRIEIVLLLVDNVRVAGPEFDQRYGALSSDADFIAYSGHSGLGANIRALARKGNWVTGQYAVVFMNGCDTYAYVDSSLADAHAAVNDDDPIGTKYVDVVTNAMPASPYTSASNIWAFVSGLLDYQSPRTFEQMFADVDSAQVVLVSGEEDNVYVPGYPNGGGGGGLEDWQGMSESGAVANGEEDRFATPKLAPGRYIFALTGDGDADLYVRIGNAPTSTSYDCRPYRASSNESCAVDLPSAAEIHIMVSGWAANSSYELTGAAE